MITIPIWLFIVLSIMSAIGGVAILMVIYARIRIRQYENKRDFDISKEIDEIWDKKANNKN